MDRPSWDKYFMNIAELASERSTCLRRQVGAVLVKDNQILATGYNGAPAHTTHCEDIGCIRQDQNIPSGQRHELCRAVHAEQNAIAQAARHGINTNYAVLYTTTQPCVICSKILINAGVREIIYKGSYPDKLSMELLEQANILVREYKED